MAPRPVLTTDGGPTATLDEVRSAYSVAGVDEGCEIHSYEVMRIFTAIEKRVEEATECFRRGGPGAREFTPT